MLTFQLNNYKQFTSIIDVADKILEEIRFEADNEGVRFSMLDKSHVCFFNANIDKDYFDEYSCEEPDTFTVSTQELLKILKRGKSNDILYVEVDTGLKCKFGGENDKEFNINLIDNDYESPKAPNLNLPNQDIITNFSRFKEYITDCEICNVDKFTIYSDEEYFIIEGGDSFSGYKGKIKVNSKLNEAKSVFSINKIQDIFKLNITNDLLISLGTEAPLFLKWNDDNLEVSYMLAPRIEQE